MLLRAEHLTRRFMIKKNQISALDDFNISIELKKGISAFVGPNGSGKTTLFKILCGLLLPTSGEIYLDDELIKKKLKRNDISMIVSGDRNLFQRNTVLENAIYYSVLRGENIANIKEKIYYYAKLLNCEMLLNRWIEGLSSGERKKASLLSGICSGGPILLIDEPTWGLDIDAILALQEMIKIIEEETQYSILISSHDVLFLSKIACQYAFMREGKCLYTVQHELESDELVELYKKVGECDVSILL